MARPRDNDSWASRRRVSGGARRRLLALALVMPACAHAGIHVDVAGLGPAERSNVEQRLSIALAAKDPALDQTAVESLHARASYEIGEALQPFGYYAPKIEARLDGAAPDWIARYTIDPGQPTLLDEVDVVVDGEGAADPELQRVLQSIPLHAGARLLHADYEAAKSALARAAYARGYLDARYTRAELSIRLSDQRADVHLTLDSGMAYEFGEITVEQDGLDPALVARYVDLVPGTRFDPNRLLEARFALTDLEYFQTVDPQPRRDRLDGRRLPVVIRTTPRLRHHYELGAGYGTDTGARVGAATEFRRLNAHGHKLALDLRLSEVKSVAGAEYKIPVGHRPGETLSFTAGAGTEKLADGKSSKYTVGASLSRIPRHWKRRYYVEFDHEDSQLGDARQTSDLLIPGVSVNRAELDNPIHARRGWSAFADVHGATRTLLANTNFLQLRLQLRGVLPLGPRGRLLGRYEYGASLVDEFSELPATQRFFAGGDESVRGYRYQSLGPRDADGKVIGGKFLNTASLETEYFPWQRWGGALFVDAGGADDDPTPPLSLGVGVGLRYRAPVGYIQVDLAHPLDGDSRGVRLHLGVRVGL